MKIMRPDSRLIFTLVALVFLHACNEKEFNAKGRLTIAENAQLELKSLEGHEKSSLSNGLYEIKVEIPNKKILISALRPESATPEIFAFNLNTFLEKSKKRSLPAEVQIPSEGTGQATDLNYRRFREVLSTISRIEDVSCILAAAVVSSTGEVLSPAREGSRRARVNHLTYINVRELKFLIPKKSEVLATFRSESELRSSSEIEDYLDDCG